MTPPAKKRSGPRPTEPPRARILRAALSAFSARGVDATSVADVAALAGMSKQALMHHFPSKERLRDAVYENLGERLRGLFPVVAAELISRSRERYGGVIELVTQRLADNAEIARFIVRELLDRPTELVAWLRAETAPWLGLVIGVVEQGRADADIKVELDAEAHVTAILALMLAQSALVPRSDERWWSRVRAAMLRVVRVASHLEPP